MESLLLALIVGYFFSHLNKRFDKLEAFVHEEIKELKKNGN